MHDEIIAITVHLPVALVQELAAQHLLHLAMRRRTPKPVNGQPADVHCASTQPADAVQTNGQAMEHGAGSPATVQEEPAAPVNGAAP